MAKPKQQKNADGQAPKHFKEYADNDAGISSNRDAYQRLIADARAGKFTHVQVAMPDRFGCDPVPRAGDSLNVEPSNFR